MQCNIVVNYLDQMTFESEFEPRKTVDIADVKKLYMCICWNMSVE